MAAVFLLGLVVLAILAVPAVRLARRRPERAALALAAIVVGAGLIATGVQVAHGVADTRIDYAGKLDVEEILDTYHPAGPPESHDPVPGLERQGLAYLSDAQGVMTVPRPDAAAVALWAVGELAPWVLAALVLGLVAPILLAAERGDPFWEGAARRLGVCGVLLLAGIPAVAMLQFAAAEVVSGSNAAAPMAEPALTLTLVQFLPGLVVLVLAGVFRRGAELRDFDRHAI
jgi:hypothetical protein